ncbi:beta-1,3-galactosyltransferase 1-like [Ptychodera flava]|uniref:beta-1,3-galactosyltransferase 1-like n=1 Tax=Ptychodera flava TaxID=63121 RepID=UPI00396A6DD7
MAPSRRFVTNFMLLSTLAMINILVYVYYTHPTLLNVRTLSTNRPKIEISKLQGGSAGVKRHANETDKSSAGGNQNQPVNNNNQGKDADQKQLPPNQGDQPPKEGGQPANQNGQNANENGQPANPNGLPANADQFANKNLAQPDKEMGNNVTKPKKIVMPHNYKFVINHPGKCFNPDTTKAEVFLLVFISSVHKNFEQRQAIRDTWGSPTMINGQRIITVFLLANVHDDNLQALVKQENDKHGDILMENFDDTYKNLTLKSIMGLKWASTYCSHARFGMKTDDDMYVSYQNIVKFLIDAPDRKLAVGYLINGAPIRDPKSKWYMPRETYPGNRYPPFLSGTGYVMSMDVIKDTYEISQYTPFIYLEDVYMGTCWEQIGVLPVKHPEFHNWKKMYQFCRYRRIMTAHMVTPNEMYRIWRDIASKKHIMCPK